ncbi:MAG: hypothetical protein K8S56_10375, partial [Candidatus Cloacimonetes bacterium]|nr:hypothetical protein [Candidatus Cloacimonadota bacterium]
YRPSTTRSVLRVFKVFFDGILINCVIMASVTLAMTKIIKAILHLSESPVITIPVVGDITSTGILLLILGGSAVLYSCLSGLYGVVYTDLFQFVLAMIGCIGLSILVYVDASRSEGGMVALLSSSPGFTDSSIKFFPDFTSMDILSFTFVVYIFVGITGDQGSGYFVQRLLATRSEKDSFLAFLWYNICHYVLRPWPWILVGLLSLHYLPDLKDSESAFPLMMDKFLPVGLKGIMVASLLAAFMSTIDTMLNCGSSYLVNDLYRPFIKPGKTQRHYVFVSRISMIVLTIIALIVTTKLTGILNAYKYLSVILGGTGTVLIARWYWWRVNAITEVVAIVASFIVGNAVEILLPSTEGADLFAIRVLITTLSVTVLWVVVALFTSKQPNDKTIEFYSKLKVPGIGWKRVRDITNINSTDGKFRYNFLGWISCVFFLYSLMLGIGKCLFHQWHWAGVYLVTAMISGYLLKYSISKISFMSK